MRRVHRERPVSHRALVFAGRKSRVEIPLFTADMGTRICPNPPMASTARCQSDAPPPRTPADNATTRLPACGFLQSHAGTTTTRG
jgi:hypothetical protein